MNMIEINNLSHRFPDGSMGIENINLTISQGDFVVIAGRNGSGKTTLLRHLNGLLRPHSGTVKIAGLPVAGNLKRVRQIVGMVFQDADSQIVGETVYDDAAFGPENLCLDPSLIRSRTLKALGAVGLAGLADQRPHLLSGGEKRRLAIAGILAMNSKVLVFDEPFSNLDYPGVRQVLREIVTLHRNGHTIVLSTHDLEKVIVHADRLIIMQKGKIVKDGVPEKTIPEVEDFGIRLPCAFRADRGCSSWLN
ncbi:MAG: ABC transporter ATP-binding protein [Deltaproteobacteria bacterium]|nr:MAG: ABC transporter ATP-binding protein [Deltaproteobacteria bacterium]